MKRFKNLFNKLFGRRQAAQQNIRRQPPVITMVPAGSRRDGCFAPICLLLLLVVIAYLAYASVPRVVAIFKETQMTKPTPEKVEMEDDEAIKIALANQPKPEATPDPTKCQPKKKEAITWEEPKVLRAEPVKKAFTGDPNRYKKFVIKGKEFPAVVRWNSDPNQKPLPSGKYDFAPLPGYGETYESGPSWRQSAERFRIDQSKLVSESRISKEEYERIIREAKGNGGRTSSRPIALKGRWVK